MTDTHTVFVAISCVDKRFRDDYKNLLDVLEEEVGSQIYDFKIPGASAVFLEKEEKAQAFIDMIEVVSGDGALVVYFIDHGDCAYYKHLALLADLFPEEYGRFRVTSDNDQDVHLANERDAVLKFIEMMQTYRRKLSKPELAEITVRRAYAPAPGQSIIRVDV